jgi:hypothetical protein
MVDFDPNADIPEILSTMVVTEVLDAILKDFTESAGGFIFEGFLAGLLGGKQIQDTGDLEAGVATGEVAGKPITDIQVGDRHYSLKLLGEKTGVKGSFKNMVEHFRSTPHIVYLDARRTGDGLVLGEFEITLKNFYDVFVEPFLKEVKGEANTFKANDQGVKALDLSLIRVYNYNIITYEVLMTRAYESKELLQQKIIRGANVLADNVASTLGPKGRNVLLQEKGKAPFITKDGVTVAHFVALDDPFENAGALVIRQAAVETNNDAGDGTTTATVLARAVLQESQKYILAGVSPTELQRSLTAATASVIEMIKEKSRPVTSIEDIKHIATISANNDSSIGDLIAMAVDRVGQDGAITIEESRSLETSLDVTEGFRFQQDLC